MNSDIMFALLLLLCAGLIVEQHASPTSYPSTDVNEMARFYASLNPKVDTEADLEVQLIETGIQLLQDLTQVDGKACIQLLPRTNQQDYISVQNYSGCSSYVGRIGSAQRLSLTPGCFSNSTIMHEFLHAFGFQHEQSRTDRDEWVTINWANIQEGREHNFVKYNESEINLLGTAYDYSSVMHYRAYSFNIDPAVPTVIPNDPNVTIGMSTTLSKLDIERVQLLYGCIKPEDTVYFKRLSVDETHCALTNNNDQTTISGQTIPSGQPSMIKGNQSSFFNAILLAWLLSLFLVFGGKIRKSEI